MRETAPCTGCLKDKPMSDFEWYKGERRKRCRACVAARRRSRYAENPEPIRSREREKYDIVKRKRKHDRSRKSARLSLLVAGAKHRSKKMGLAFDLDSRREELDERFASGVCELTGLPFDMEAVKKWNAPSLHRRVPDKGYVATNTLIVLWAVNAACGDWGEDILAEVSSAFLRRRTNRVAA